MEQGLGEGEGGGETKDTAMNTEKPIEPPVLVESSPVKITAKELSSYDITHLRAGAGFAMAHDFGDDFCLLTPTGPEFEARAYLAWKPLLSVTIRDEKPVPAENKRRLVELRDGLANGRLKVVESHVRENIIDI